MKHYFLTLDEISINLEIFNFINIITVCVHEVCARVQVYTHHSACVSVAGHSGELYLSSIVNSWNETQSSGLHG